MKIPAILFLCLTSFCLCSCSGSDTYRGTWKATDPQGKHFIIVFEAKHFSVTDNAGSSNKYDYTQNQISIENSVSTSALSWLMAGNTLSFFRWRTITAKEL